jgi:hypothetical protein
MAARMTLRGVLGADVHQRPAAVSGVREGLDDPLLPQSGDRLGHVALRHAGADGDIADGAARVGEDVGQHQARAGRLGGRRLAAHDRFADPGQLASEHDEVESHHIGKDTSNPM